MTVSLVCDGEGLIVEAVDAAGARYTWVEGAESVERIVVAWAEREAEGYTVVYDMGTAPLWSIDIECPVPVDGVALVSLWGPGGQRIQGMALDPLEWPGGPGAYAALVVGGSTSIGGAARWLERRREEAAVVLEAIAGVPEALLSFGATVVNDGRNAVGGGLIAIADKVDALPTPQEAADKTAEALGRFLAVLSEALARASGKGLYAFWDELGPGGKVVAAGVGGLAVFIGARALGRALT